VSKLRALSEKVGVMSNEVDLVFNGFVRLRASEKDEVLRRIRESTASEATRLGL